MNETEILDTETETLPVLGGWDSIDTEQILLFLDNIELFKWIGLYIVGGLFGIISLLAALIFFVAWRSA